MSHIALQIEREIAGSVAVNDAVIFETTVFSSGDISYDSSTGIITLSEPGTYMLDWWVATQASIATTGPTFSLISSQGSQLEGCSPIKTGQLNGIGLVEVTASPVTISLVNTSAEAFYYPPSVPTKAALIVVQNTDTEAYGALLTDEGQISLTSSPVEIPLTLQSGAFLNIDFSVPNAITITEAGVYRIDIFLSGLTVGTASITLALNINGSSSSIMIQSLEFTAINTTTFTLLNYLTLAAGDVLTLELSATPDTTFQFPPFGPGGGLSIQKVS